MYSLVLLLLIACDTSLGYYRGYDSRNLMERELSTNGIEGLVECPVCDETDHWLPSNEVCPITKGNRTYKKCERGTYKNKVCDNRPDCFRGPGEPCTEKHEFDMYGQRCAPGLYCNKHLGVCQGWDYEVDTRVQYMLNPTPYTFEGRHRGGFGENDLIRV